MEGRAGGATARREAGLRIDRTVARPIALERRYALAGNPEAMAGCDHHATNTCHSRSAAEDPDAKRVTVRKSRGVRRPVTDGARTIRADARMTMRAQPCRLKRLGSLAVYVGAADVMRGDLA